jgi:hypothetical protein
MIGHRTTARGALLLTLAAAVLAVAAWAANASATATAAEASVPRIVFPLLSDVPVHDNFGDPRPQGRHEGIDIEGAPRRTPVLAAEAGTVRWHTRSSLAGCMLYLDGAGGTQYIYIHLNNDRTLRNDNSGRCELGTAYAVKDGASVTAGELIGYNGDSGDADGNPHLHFEVHPRGGAAVNPLRHLENAERLLFPGRIGKKVVVGLRGTRVGSAPGRLTMRVVAVRWWPGGRWTTLGGRVVSLRVPPESDQAAALDLAVRGDRPATVFTAPARATAEALRGYDGALVAARVIGADGTQLELAPGALDWKP